RAQAVVAERHDAEAEGQLLLPVERDAVKKQNEGFAGLGLDARIVEALTTLGYEEPTPIQQQTITPLIDGRDLLGQAATGTGKTAAFALPILQRLIDAGGSRATCVPGR